MTATIGIGLSATAAATGSSSPIVWLSIGAVSQEKSCGAGTGPAPHRRHFFFLPPFFFLPFLSFFLLLLLGHDGPPLLEGEVPLAADGEPLPWLNGTLTGDESGMSPRTVDIVSHLSYGHLRVRGTKDEHGRQQRRRSTAARRRSRPPTERLFRLTVNRKMYARQAAAVGAVVTRAGYALLRTLDDSGPLNTGELARRSHMDPGATVRQVKALEDDGLVTRANDDDDARVTVVVAHRAGTQGRREHRRGAHRPPRGDPRRLVRVRPRRPRPPRRPPRRRPPDHILPTPSQGVTMTETPTSHITFDATSNRHIDYAGSVHDEREIEAVVEVLRGGPDRAAHRQEREGDGAPRRRAVRQAPRGDVQLRQLGALPRHRGARPRAGRRDRHRRGHLLDRHRPDDPHGHRARLRRRHPRHLPDRRRRHRGDDRPADQGDPDARTSSATRPTGTPSAPSPTATA